MWDIRFLQDTRGDERGDVCNIPLWTFQAIFHQHNSLAWKKLQVINSALREMNLSYSEMLSHEKSIIQNHSLILFTDVISQMAHIWNLMLPLGSLQSTLNALDFSSDASQAAVCSALCARCSKLSTWWPWIALDMGHWLGLSMRHHATDILPDLALKKTLFPCCNKSILGHFSCSICSFWPHSLTWNWAVHGLWQVWILSAAWKRMKHGMAIISCSRQAPDDWTAR